MTDAPFPGELLPGGNVGGAWRIGDTVRRATGAWTPAVHALLGHLESRLPEVPRVLGIDEQGREMLTFLPGRIVDVDTEQLTPAQLRSLVLWTRRLHAAVADFAHPGPWRWPGAPHPTLVGHNDIAPYNAVFEGDALSGVFDWDFAGPTTPLYELAFIAWNCVPLWRDIGAVPAARRLEIIASAYGTFSAGQILHAVPPRVALMLDWIPRAAELGDEGVIRLVDFGEPERSWQSLDGLTRRIPEIAANLRRQG